MATRARYAEVVQGNLRHAAQELSGRPADLVRTRMTLTNLDLDWDETTGEDETRDGAGREVANRAWDAALYEAVDRAIESFPLDRPDAHSPRASGAPSGAASPPATGDVPDRVGGHTRGADVRDNKEPTMNRPAEHAEVRPPDLDTVQRDVDHALSRRIELLAAQRHRRRDRRPRPAPEPVHGLRLRPRRTGERRHRRTQPVPRRRTQPRRTRTPDPADQPPRPVRLLAHRRDPHDRVPRPLPHPQRQRRPGTPGRRPPLSNPGPRFRAWTWSASRSSRRRAGDAPSATRS